MQKEFEKQMMIQKVLRKHGNMQVVDNLHGFVLDGRYKVRKALSEGAFGKIYEGQDKKQKLQGIRKPVIIKFTKNHEMNDREFDALTDIIRYTKTTFGCNDLFAETYTKGKVLINDKSLTDTKNKPKSFEIEEAEVEDQIWSYIVQEKLGDTLENYLFEKDEPFSEKTVLQTGIQLIDSFKMIHEAGYTFNDLKLDNVLIGDAPDLAKVRDSLHKIRIIDFGLAKKYMQPNGQHIVEQKEKLFQGNMIFASKNAFNMKTQSRRDDLISLCYFLLYLVDGDLAFL
jgi:serine/threonine protein kinase